MDKVDLAVPGIWTRFMTRAVLPAGWDQMKQIRERAGITQGRVGLVAQRRAPSTYLGTARQLLVPELTGEAAIRALEVPCDRA